MGDILQVVIMPVNVRTNLRLLYNILVNILLSMHQQSAFILDLKSLIFSPILSFFAK